MKLETKIQLEHRLKNDVKQRIKDRINERMEVHIKHFQNKTKQKMQKIQLTYTPLIRKDTITFNTMYLTIKLNLKLIYNISLITPK